MVLHQKMCPWEQTYRPLFLEPLISSLSLFSLSSAALHWKPYPYPHEQELHGRLGLSIWAREGFVIPDIPQRLLIFLCGAAGTLLPGNLHPSQAQLMVSSSVGLVRLFSARHQTKGWISRNSVPSYILIILAVTNNPWRHSQVHRDKRRFSKNSPS